MKIATKKTKKKFHDGKQVFLFWSHFALIIRIKLLSLLNIRSYGYKHMSSSCFKPQNRNNNLVDIISRYQKRNVKSHAILKLYKRIEWDGLRSWKRMSSLNFFQRIKKGLICQFLSFRNTNKKNWKAFESLFLWFFIVIKKFHLAITWFLNLRMLMSELKTFEKFLKKISACQQRNKKYC